MAIGDYIAKSDPARADSFVEELHERCLSLSQSPLAFEKIRGRNVRKRPYGRYLILYEVGANRIEVLCIIHGARNYLRILGRK